MNKDYDEEILEMTNYEFMRDKVIRWKKHYQAYLDFTRPLMQKETDKTMKLLYATERKEVRKILNVLDDILSEDGFAECYHAEIKKNLEKAMPEIKKPKKELKEKKR